MKSAKSTDSKDEIGHAYFPSQKAYAVRSAFSPEVYECQPPVIVTDEQGSPMMMQGGCPCPMTILGSWGPGDIYQWLDYMKNGSKSKAIAELYNQFALPNGVGMIHWKKNNFDSSLNDKCTVEVMTGWGSFPSKKLAGDYGWINGVIANFAGKGEASFIHIYYRQEPGFLCMWELKLDKAMEKDAEILYTQLKALIDSCWDFVNGDCYPKVAKVDFPQPLASVIDQVTFMKLLADGRVAAIDSKYWGVNSACSSNNNLGGG